MKLKTDKMIAEKEGRIGWATFNNPEKRNAMSLDMWQAMSTILADFQKDHEVRVVVLKGAGDKAFISGADISEFEKNRNSAEAKEEYEKQAEIGRSRLYGFDKPLIAMIQGFCFGGGVAIALGADIRFAAEDARFSIPAARLGLGYGYSSTKTLTDLVGPSHAKDILFSARVLNAAEALRIGMVNRVVPRDQLESTVREYARIISNNAPLTIKLAKAAVREILKNPEERDLQKINQLTNDCFDSKDYAEGRRAFMEKRKPAFAGK